MEECRRCGEEAPAVVYVTVTDKDGTLLDRGGYCKHCTDHSRKFGGGLFQMDLDPGEVKA